jgi:thioredoxin reductase
MPDEREMLDVIIVGGGPAGLTAAMYAVQKKLNAVMVTRDLGGKTNYHLQLPFVERHMVINGDEVVSRFSREIEYLDYALKIDNVENIDAIERGYAVRLSSGALLRSRALIICTGSKAQLLNVPGEREYMMRGLCYSALSYAQLFIDRTVAVFGDKGLALRASAELARVARHVTLIAPTHGDLDSALGRRLAQTAHVAILEGYEVEQIVGDTYARKVQVNRADERREIEVDGMFVELDLIPRSGMVEHLVELDAQKRIKINCKNETSRKGIFAAGDVTDTYAEQVLVSIGEGAKAALSAYEYLIAEGIV